MRKEENELKKTNKIIEETEHLEVEALINKTALVTSNRGISGLYNTNTKTFIGELDAYKNYYSKRSNVIWQIKECASGKKLIGIYDTLEEKMIIDGWEYIANNDYIITRSPDRKYHLFDSQCFRENNNLLYKPFDEIKSFYKRYGFIYFLVIKDGKKGLYASNGVEAHLTSIDYDNIEVKKDSIIFTRNNKKRFENIETNFTSDWYDELTIDEINPCFVYCTKGKEISVYDKEKNEIILKVNCDKMQCFSQLDDNKYIFVTYKDGNFGLVQSTILYNTDELPQYKTLLEPKYDSITTTGDKSLFYLKNDEKAGLFKILDDEHNLLMKPSCDNIELIKDDIFAFYKGEHCDIGEINKKPLFKDITIKDERVNGLLLVNRGVIYEKDDKAGLLDLRYGSIYGFDKITRVVNNYYILENSGKKGLWCMGEYVLPVEYDDITVKETSDGSIIYMALKTKNGYKLAWRRQYIDEEVHMSEETYYNISFFKDIFVLKGNTCQLICNYKGERINACYTNTIIKEIKTDKNNGYLYYIDGIYYTYMDGKLVEAPMEINKYYVTTYETDSEVFELITSDEEEYKRFNKDMDSLDDQFAEKYLSNSETVKESYPKLTLKRLKKCRDINDVKIIF